MVVVANIRVTGWGVFQPVVKGRNVIPFPKTPAISSRHAEIADLIVGDGCEKSDDVESVLLLVALAELLIYRSAATIGRADLDEIVLATTSLLNSVAGIVG
jgi:hypothetical protein